LWMVLSAGGLGLLVLRVLFPVVFQVIILFCCGWC
jgi:hypothetical protein